MKLLDEVVDIEDIIGLEETEPGNLRDALMRNKAQQQQLAALCYDAACERWPAFDAISKAVAQREKEILAKMGPTA